MYTAIADGSQVLIVEDNGNVRHIKAELTADQARGLIPCLITAVEKTNREEAVNE
ncbi:MAG: hypothetical protein ACLFNL_09695 [Bacteroidales bacterium]